MFTNFSTEIIHVDSNHHLFARIAGSGKSLLLLHGFPETHLMWDDVAGLLVKNYRVICVDLPGYGQSSCPGPAPDHVHHSKKAFAKILISLMDKLEIEQFTVVGHDRGGRVAYRMAMDYPGRIERLIVLDIVPGNEAWNRANAEFALAFWPWSFLAQPEPLPESLINASPNTIIDNALAEWGSFIASFTPEKREAYVLALSFPDHVHAICEEYRAAADIDRTHDEENYKTGRLIDCPTLILWSCKGGLNSWYQDNGGPLGIWKKWAKSVTGASIDGGHFFPEEKPAETAQAIIQFLETV